MRALLNSLLRFDQNDNKRDQCSPWCLVLEKTLNFVLQTRAFKSRREGEEIPADSVVRNYTKAGEKLKKRFEEVKRFKDSTCFMPCSPIVLVSSSYLRRPHEPNNAFVTHSQALFEVRCPIICFSFIFVFCNNSIMIVACSWNRNLCAVLLQFFTMSSVDFCLQSTRLKMRKSRDIYFLVKHFASRFSCFAETCDETLICT